MVAVMVRALLVLLSVSFAVNAQEYWHRAALTFGGLVPAGGSQTSGYDTAPVLSFDYGFRFHRYGQFDAGVDAAFASVAFERSSTRTNIYVPRVGYSLIVPVWRDRIEAMVGAGGAYSFFKPTVTEETWLVYGQFGGNYAIDVDKRYRAGLTVRWYRDPIGTPVQQWVSVGGTFSYNWGR